MSFFIQARLEAKAKASNVPTQDSPSAEPEHKPLTVNLPRWLIVVLGLIFLGQFLAAVKYKLQQ